MLPIPRFNYINSISSSALVCNASATYPSGVATPTIWYKADAATASADTANKNTVNSTSKFSRMYDFGSKGIHLNNVLAGNDYFEYDATKTKNTNTIFVAPADSSARYNLDNNIATTVGVAGEGTIIIAFKTGYSTGVGFPANYAGNFTFQARNPNTQAYGFRMESSNRATIFGDSQSYTFTTLESTDYIRVVSVASSGNPTYYKQNGVTGATASYDTMSNQGSTLNVSLEQSGTLNTDWGGFYEAMFFETPLSASDCDAIESYLKQKWCISY